MLVGVYSDNKSYEKSVYSNPDLDCCVLAYINEKLVAHVGITKREVTTNDRKFIIGGVGDVGVCDEYRNRGVGTEIMKYTNTVLKKEGYDLGLLFCHPNLDKFYSKCGWKQKQQGKIFAIRHGVVEDQRRSYFFPITLTVVEVDAWNTFDFNVGIGSW